MKKKTKTKKKVVSNKKVPVDHIINKFKVSCNGFLAAANIEDPQMVKNNSDLIFIYMSGFLSAFINFGYSQKELLEVVKKLNYERKQK